MIADTSANPNPNPVAGNDGSGEMGAWTDVDSVCQFAFVVDGSLGVDNVESAQTRGRIDYSPGRNNRAGAERRCRGNRTMRMNEDGQMKAPTFEKRALGQSNARMPNRHGRILPSIFEQLRHVQSPYYRHAVAVCSGKRVRTVVDKRPDPPTV